MKNPFFITPEIKEQIKVFVRPLKGTKNHIAEIAAAKFIYSVPTIKKVMNEMKDVSWQPGNIPESEKVYIRQLYDTLEGNVDMLKFNAIAVKVRRSTTAIRNVIKGVPPKKEEMFNPRIEAF